jgi:hypothetical protein
MARGLTRHLHDKGVRVVEVDRPNRQERRRAGKSDPLDAVEAARAALSGRAKSIPKTRNGSVEAIRVLRVARSSARKDRVEALNQIRSLISTAPEVSAVTEFPVPCISPSRNSLIRRHGIP